MGESKVLLCQHRYSEDVMVKLEFKIHSAFYSRFLVILLPNRI